ncbi:iron-siderophore ABC transporter substrate-binding protein [Brevibacterium sp.]|uniref:iron-siderophore ABC transporter substrate-binding protein n=1 Tax=Brevibacterium sp. TaxID=1701 RepID=UPI00281198A1|nr:iron-siderophore ABC transporter substrate-binding protein [Brevibacterium sp.]
MSLKTLPRTSLLTVASATAVCALTLAGCGTTSTEKPAGDATAAASESCENDSTKTSTEPVTVTDDLGEKVELDKPAAKVVSLEWQFTEDLLSLCVSPSAVADAKGYSTWVSAEKLPEGVADVGTRQEPNVESILAADPDLVIAEVASRNDKVVKQIEDQGVPVLALQGANAEDPIKYMKDAFSLIGEATGRTERAESVLKGFDAKLAESKKEVSAADLPNKEFVYFDGYVDGANVALRPFGQGSLMGELGESLGLKNAWTGEVDPAYGLGQTDIEGLAEVGNGMLFYTGTEDPESENYVELLKKNDIWANIPAVKEDRTHAFPEGIWTFGGPKSSEQALDAYVDALTK